MAITQLTPFSSATAMLRALQNGQISAVELLDLHLHQIAQQNPTLNAIVTPDFERARRTAEETDVARARGEDRLLLGLPVTIKDCLDVEGLPTTAGDPNRARAIAANDGLVAARLRAAGAVIMGKTNGSLYAGDWHADPAFRAHQQSLGYNAYARRKHRRRRCGSGRGHDTTGIRQRYRGLDSSSRGVLRLLWAQSDWHRASPFRTFSRFFLPNPTMTMAVQGPLARSAVDLEPALQAAAGPEIGEDAAWRITLPPARHERLKDYRVAVHTPFPWLPIDNDILQARERLVGQLRRLGTTVKDAQPETFGDGREFYQLYFSLMAVVISLEMPA
jgi:amidase